MDQALFYSLLAVIFYPREAYNVLFYPSVFWSPTNCRFNQNKYSDKGYSINVKPMTNMVFVCPHMSIWAGKSDMGLNRKMMYENILLVDEESYRSCSIKNSTSAKTFLRCDQDPMGNEIKFSLENFAQVQAHQEKQCYEMGHHYYFISTSDGSIESLNSTEGGHCKTHHMKLHIYICRDNETCEFEMPECPNEGSELQDNNEDNATKTPSRNCTENSGSISAQTGVARWFDDNRHSVFYAVMGLFILILLVIIFFLVHSNRKYRHSSPVMPEPKREKKPSIQKELIC